MKTFHKAICHLQSISFGKMCICNSQITEEKTIWGFKGQMLPVKYCPYSNEAPGAMFWSERLKWVQWIAQAVISHIRKVTFFKKGHSVPEWRAFKAACHILYSTSAFSQSARAQPVALPQPAGVVSGCPSTGTLWCWPLHFNISNKFTTHFLLIRRQQIPQNVKCKCKKQKCASSLTVTCCLDVTGATRNPWQIIAFMTKNANQHTVDFSQQFLSFA